MEYILIILQKVQQLNTCKTRCLKWLCWKQHIKTPQILGAAFLSPLKVNGFLKMEVRRTNSGLKKTSARDIQLTVFVAKCHNSVHIIRIVHNISWKIFDIDSHIRAFFNLSSKLGNLGFIFNIAILLSCQKRCIWCQKQVSSIYQHISKDQKAKW